jgi:hypothetical protein
LCGDIQDIHKIRYFLRELGFPVYSNTPGGFIEEATGWFCSSSP